MIRSIGASPNALTAITNRAWRRAHVAANQVDIILGLVAGKAVRKHVALLSFRRLSDRGKIIELLAASCV
jgi:hypothetical protein